MNDIRQILTLHKITDAAGLPADKLLCKDLFHADTSVVLSAIRALQSLEVVIPVQTAMNLYSKSSWEIQRRLLEYFRACPAASYAELLAAVLPGALSETARAAILKTLGAQPDLAQEHRELLRQKLQFQNPSEEQRRGALEGLGLAGEHLYLAEFARTNLEVEGEHDFVLTAIRSIREQPCEEVFQSLHRLLRSLIQHDEERLFTPLGQEVIRALFETYADEPSIQALFVQLKDRLAGYCRSLDANRLQWTVQTLNRLDLSDAGFAVRCITSLLLVRNSSSALQQSKADLFWKMHSNLGDSLHFKGLASIFEKVLYGVQQDLTERKQLMELKHAREPKADVVEFFESLQHPNLLATVISYLKSTPPDENMRGLIINILRKMQGSLNPRQRSLLPSVLKQLMMEDGRARAALAVECGKVDLEKSPARILRHLKFLIPVTTPFLSDRILRQMQQLYTLTDVFEEARVLRVPLLQAILKAGDKSSFTYVWKKCHELDEDACEEVLKAIDKIEFSWVAFLKPEFARSQSISARRISQLIRLLHSAGRVEDVEWQRILLQMHKGRFGELNEDLNYQILNMLAQSGNPGSLDAFSHLLKSRGYILSQPDVDVLFSYTQAILKTDFSEYQEQLKDLTYACLKSENEFYYTDLGYILFLSGEEQGINILRKSFDSKNPSVLCKAADYASRCELSDAWRSIMGFVAISDFRLHNQIVQWFKSMAATLEPSAVLGHLEALREGRTAGTDASFLKLDLEVEESDRLQSLFANIRSMRSSHKARYELQQNMQELTIFFIDIAGYTKKSATSDIGEVMLMLDEFSRIITPIGKQFRGTLIKKIGDCYMYTYESPIEAVMASLEVQSRLQEYNEFRVEKDRLNTRIGLNTGKVFLQDEDVYGDPVNVASRVESKAPLNGLLANETTWEPVQDFVISEALEPVSVKGVDKPLKTYWIKGLKAGVKEAYFESLEG